MLSCGNQSDPRRCYPFAMKCKGSSNCFDNTFDEKCSESSDISCNDQFMFESCGQVSKANYKNYGCKFQTQFSIGSLNYFDCLNRMDRADTMFQRPIRKEYTEIKSR